jgi:hypothetical protein
MGKHYDLSDNKVVIAPQDQNQKRVDQLSAINTKLQALATAQNAGMDEVELIVDDIQDQLNALDLGTAEERAAILQVIEALKNTEGDIGVETLKALDVIADTFNKYKTTDDINLVFNFAEGTATIDVSGYGFANKEDYTIVLVPESVPAGKLPHMTFAKVDKNSVSVNVVDGEYLLEVAHPYDGATDGAAFNVAGTITYKPADISFKVTDYLGNEQNIGS